MDYGLGYYHNPLQKSSLQECKKITAFSPNEVNAILRMNSGRKENYHPPNQGHGLLYYHDKHGVQKVNVLDKRQLHPKASGIL
tara:strand:- start:198 stop:446 length:249 start_codon:yes stop_codon:yes gene_type:complete